MLLPDIISLIQAQTAEAVVAASADGLHPHVRVKPERLLEVCSYIKTEPQLNFDLLRCISAIDRPQEALIELSYDVLSIPLNHAIAVKVMLDRARPEIDSVCSIWPAAEWHEREAFDLMGVSFKNHPDLRRILMPDDWSGYPLRKDYQDLTEYHGLKIKP
ncbi:MAG: NADH-quinone oxidoreductase subunit C [Thermodesulfobacteriota bacterium]